MSIARRRIVAVALSAGLALLPARALASDPATAQTLFDQGRRLMSQGRWAAPVLRILAGSPLLLLFTIAAIGYLAGRVRIAGIGLGVAAVLFVGLAFGALDERLKLPELVQTFGLVLFVYTVGLGSGPGFFASLRRRGLAINGAGLALLAGGAAVVFALARALGLDGATAAGLFAGSLTNTPALAAVVEGLSGQAEALRAAPVVAYSVTYPLGVLGILGAVALTERSKAKASTVEPDAGEARALMTSTLIVSEAGGRSIGDLVKELGLHVVFTRLHHQGSIKVPTGETVLADGDLLTCVGGEKDVAAAAEAIGEPSSMALELDRRALDFRRVFVSSPSVVGVPLRELGLPQRLGAIVTRVRRGDVDLLADADLVLELGDRVRVVAPRDRMGEVAKLFGDSYRALCEIDVITFGLGVMLGLLVGMLKIGTFSLGAAGGPLLVGLVLGRLGRTGPLLWSLPFSANLTLRQLGLVLFLAGVGSRSGHAFATMLGTGSGPTLLAAGACVTVAVAAAAVLVMRRALRLPVEQVLGILAGLQTQPAALAFAVDRTRSDRPNVGYATVYPMATIAKIVLAQVLYALLR